MRLQLDALKSALLNRDDSKSLREVLRRTKQNHEESQLFSAVLELIDEQDEVFLDEDVLAFFDAYFPTVSPLFAAEHSKRLAQFIERGKSRRWKDAVEFPQNNVTSALLLHSLISTAQFLSALKLRDWIKSELVELCCALSSGPGDPFTRTLLAMCVYYTLSMEYHYLPTVDETTAEQICTIWSKVAERGEGLAVVESCSFLLYTTLNDKDQANHYSKAMSKRLEGLKPECEKFVVDTLAYNQNFVLMNFLIAHLSTLCLTLSSKRLRNVFRFVVGASVCFARFEQLLTVFSRLVNVRYDCRAPKIQDALMAVLRDCEALDIADGATANGNAKKEKISNGSSETSAGSGQKRKWQNGSSSSEIAAHSPTKLKLFNGVSGNVFQSRGKSIRLEVFMRKKDEEAIRYATAADALQRDCRAVADRLTEMNDDEDSSDECICTLDAMWRVLDALFTLIDETKSSGLPQNVVKQTLSRLNSSKLNHLLEPRVFAVARQRKAAGRLLAALREFVDQRSDFRVPINLELVDLMLAEESGEMKTNALGLATAVIRKSKLYKRAEVCEVLTLAMGLLRTAGRLRIDCEPLADALYAFLCAEIGFLSAALERQPGIVKAQAPLVLAVLPDFFVELATYKHEGCYAKFDKMSHALATLCHHIVREKNALHRLLPFAISNSMVEMSELNHPLYLLLSACDTYDFALLSTNLGTKEKLKFAHLKELFYQRNKIVG